MGFLAGNGFGFLGIIFWIFIQWVYPLIRDFYNIFLIISTYKFLSLEEIKTLQNNLYVLMSVIALFAVGFKLIQIIVNPDLMDDKKKGIRSTYVRVLIAVLLVIIVPFAFNILIYNDDSIQNHIIDNNVIQKQIFGIDTGDQDVGQILAWESFSAFVQLCTQEDKSNGDCTGVSEQDNIDEYNCAARADADCGEGESGINSIRNWDESMWGSYDYKWNPLLSLIAGVVILYEMVLLCMDTALRSIKLTLLQLMTPIVLGAYIFKEDILGKWAKEIISTFLSLFLKVVAITYMIIGVSKIGTMFSDGSLKTNMGGGAHIMSNWLAQSLIKMLIIIGLLQLFKQIPNLINTIFGTHIQSRGGIKGRLGEMAGVGALAQRAWSTIGNVARHPVKAASAVGSAIGGTASHIAASVSRGRGLRERMQAQGRSRGEANRAMIGSIAGGVLTSGFAGLRAGRSGWKNGNLQGIGEQAQRYENTHIGTSTLGGRIVDTARAGLGFRTRAEEDAVNASRLDVTSNAGITHRRMNSDELQAWQKPRAQVRDSANKIRTTIQEGLENSTTQITLQDVVDNITGTTLRGNYAQIKSQIEALAQAGPQNGMSAADHASLIANLTTNLERTRDNARDDILNQIMANGALDATYNGHHITANNVPGGLHFQAGQTAVINGEYARITDILNDGANAELRQDMQGTNGANITTNNTTGYVAFGAGTQNPGGFMGNAMQTIFGDLANVDRAINQHNDAESARRNTEEGRRRQDESTAVRSVRPGSGGNNNNNRH